MTAEAPDLLWIVLCAALVFLMQSVPGIGADAPQ
jgi:ammonia channel protein AmtB